MVAGTDKGDISFNKPEHYFEGVLQLRNCSDEVVAFVLSSIKSDKKARIARIEKKKNGIDYYLSSQRYLRSLGKKIREKFSGELIESRKLFSRNRQTSRNIYRVFVMFRQHNIRKGDIISLRGEKLKVVSLGARISVKDSKGRKRFVEFSELRKT